MKHILILFLALSFTGFTGAVEPVVTVTATNVLVDGQPSGAPIDTIRNRPELASAIQSALEAYCATLITERAAALTAQAEAEALLAANVTRQAELVTTAKAALTGNGSATEKLAALAAVLTDAAKSVADREREKLEAEAAALEKQLAEKRAAVEKLE